MENTNIPPQQQQNIFPGGQMALPNATAVLVLGIVSIVTCFCYGIIGLICGVIALVLAKKDMALFNAAPGQYSESSFKNLKAGRTCAIIGVALSALYLTFVIVMLALVGTVSMAHWQEILKQH